MTGGWRRGGSSQLAMDCVRCGKRILFCAVIAGPFSRCHRAPQARQSINRFKDWIAVLPSAPKFPDEIYVTGIIYFLMNICYNYVNF
jgi:hypothetical protein